MTGRALVPAQPRWMRAARDAWEHAGLRCAIVASPLGGWNGYVQLPPCHPWRARAWLDLPGDLTWGPDGDGWVGFDTAHAGDAWHPDDDHPPYWPFPDPAQLVPPAALQAIAELRRQLALSIGNQLWTLPRLRGEVERLAERLAAGR
jgi:hypothetical protein